MTFATGASVYDRLVGRYSAALAAAFCDAVGVTPGETAIDVGCGTGALVGELGVRLGRKHVVGVDPSEAFLDVARAALPGATLVRASGEALPFEDDAFDVAMSQLVLSHMADARQGASEMRRVARRLAAACVWDYAEGMTMLRAFWDGALATDPEAPDEARSMPYSTPPELEALWQATGLREVTTGELVVSADYADFDDYWSPFPIGPGPSGAYAASLDEARLAALRSAVFRRLGSPDGPFRLTARAWYVSGSVSG